MDARRRKLRFRAWRRGFKELDLIMGSFADVHLAELDETGLDEFEALLNASDQDVYAWICRRDEPPLSCKGPVLDMLRAHRL